MKKFTDFYTGEVNPENVGREQTTCDIIRVGSKAQRKQTKEIERPCLFISFVCALYQYQAEFNYILSGLLGRI